MNGFFFLILPFLQVGFSYWLSFQVVMAILVLWRVRQLLASGFLSDFVPKAAAIFAIYWSLLFNISSASILDFIRNGREAFFLLLLVTVSQTARQRLSFPSIARMEKAALIMVCGLTLLIFVQAYFLSRNIYFGIPQAFFLGDFGTLPTENSILFATGDIRPTATFNEPSYCGFVFLSVFLMFWRRAAASRNARIMIGLIILDAFVLRSFSFLGSIFVISCFAFFRHIRLRKVVPFLLATACCMPLIIYFSKFALLVSRFSEVSSTGDYSTLARIGVPSIIMFPYLLAHPFGVPASHLVEILSSYTLPFGMAGDEILQNAVFNFFFLYGIAAIPILWVILRSGGDIVVKLYIFFCANFNGGLLTVDKLGVMCLAICVYESAKLVAARTHPDARTVTVTRPPLYPNPIKT